MRSLDPWFSQSFDALSKRDLLPVDVAVLDTGVDATHPDLAGRVVDAFSVDVEDGRARVTQADGPHNADVFGHGTGVASVIARLAPNARIVDIRVLGAGNYGTSAALIGGLKLAVERRIRIVNMSLAAKGETAPSLWPLCELAYRQNQVIVAARRNVPLMDEGFPAEFSSCISVDRDRFSSPYALRYYAGKTIEYAAHGDDVIVAAPGGGHTRATGTSFATPAVSAMCALLLGGYPNLRPFEIKTILKGFTS